MRYKIYSWLYSVWHSFWYHLIYRSKRIANYRKTINRFTGEHRVYRVHPLAKVGVGFSPQQIEVINQLLADERTSEAQELVVQDVEAQFEFDGLIEAYINAVKSQHPTDTSPLGGHISKLESDKRHSAHIFRYPVVETDWSDIQKPFTIELGPPLINATPNNAWSRLKILGRVLRSILFSRISGSR